MFIQIDESNILSAAEIHSASWQASHKSFCGEDFVKKHTPLHQKEYLLNELRQGKQIWMLIDEKPVGIVSVYNSLIENLYVLPSEQHKGFGTRLLTFAIKSCTGKPHLWVLSNNKKACALYKKLGFIKTGNKKSLTPEIYEIEMSLQ